MQELRDKTPFHCIITGPTNCGKTKFLVDQLRGHFRHVFEYIVLICPTFARNRTYHGFAKGDKRFLALSPDANNGDEINELLTHTADLLSGSRLLGETSRSVCVGTHPAVDIDRKTAVIAFHNPSQTGTKGIFEDYGGDLNAETRKRLTHLLKTERYSRLCFCLRFPFQCYLEIPTSSI